FSILGIIMFLFFFFSSRRRHTRFSRDWSSDVCSSDLTQLVEYRLGGLSLLSAIVRLLILDRRDVADGFEEPVIVEPPDPFEGRELDILMAAARSAAPNHLRLEEADHRLGQCVVIGVAATADGRLDAGLSKPLRVANREIVRAAIARVYEPLLSCVFPLADR